MDNKGKIIDIFTKKPLVEPKIDFYTRFEACQSNRETMGICKCITCIAKQKLAKKLIKSSMKLCREYMKESGDSIFWGDCLEIHLLASRMVKEFVTKGNKYES